MVEQNKKFQEELKLFNQHKAEYIKTYLNQFVLIKGKEFAGSFTTEEEAYKAGLEKFGNEPFLIKQVIEKEAEVSFPALTVGVMNFMPVFNNVLFEATPQGQRISPKGLFVAGPIINVEISIPKPLADY